MSPLVTISGMPPSPDSSSPADQQRGFATTRWTLVLGAGGQSAQAQSAMAELCARYWFPLYAYVRRRGYQAAEAQDLTQDFFARLLEKNVVAQALPERGRFRTFLLSSLGNFLANEWDYQQRLKRGGGRAILSFEVGDGESRWQLEPADADTPEKTFQRHWATALL